MDILDARGLSCPEPVVMMRAALSSGEPAYRMVVDAVAAKENVTRFAEHRGYDVTVTEKDGEYTLDVVKH